MRRPGTRRRGLRQRFEEQRHDGRACSYRGTGRNGSARCDRRRAGGDQCRDATRRQPVQPARSDSSPSSRSTSTTPWSTRPRRGTSDHPEVELIFAQGASGTDDEGEIAAIESMVTQGVKAIVITPTSPNVQDALQKAVDGGIKVILVDNDIPGWDGKTSLVATDNLAGGVLAGKFMAREF